MTASVDRVLASAIEGQAQSLRFIQRQLSKLHTALVQASLDIQASTTKESSITASEAEIQYSQLLNNVKELFVDSDFGSALQSEYRVAKSENAPGNLSPYGTVYIVPSNFNLVYSTVTAVAAAIAAGNCVILEVSALRLN
jgi:acyl-CoA reductase-like NAD-dependent aldehyde dehydrogenase